MLFLIYSRTPPPFCSTSLSQSFLNILNPSRASSASITEELAQLSVIATVSSSDSSAKSCSSSYFMPDSRSRKLAINTFSPFTTPTLSSTASLRPSFPHQRLYPRDYATFIYFIFILL